MKKILYGLIAAVCFGIAATAGAAGQRCLNNDPNYPMSYGHAKGEAQNYVNTAERELSFATGEARSMEVVKKVDNYTTDHYQIEKTYEAKTGAMHFTISKFVEKKERSSGTVWFEQPQANPYNPYGLPSTATRDPYSNW